MNGDRRIALKMTAILLVALTMFSAFFIILEADHDCSGEDCPVCAAIQLFGNILRYAGTKPDAITAVAALAFAIIYLSAAGYTARVTPVSVKVRMNN